MQTIGNVWLWGGFAVVVIAALLVDLVLMRHGGAHKVTFREATWWSIGWVLLALAFNAALWWYLQGGVGDAKAIRSGCSSSPATWWKNPWRSTTSSCS